MTALVRSYGNADKILALGAVCLAALVMPLSFTGPALALPAIGAALGGSPLALSWVSNAFMLSFGSSLMAAGALADAYGRKRVFLGGVALFTASALALAGAGNIWQLDLLRALQGVASAAAFAGGLAALAQEFDQHARTRAFSLIGTTFGVGLAFGPLLSGYLVAAWGWRAIFVAAAAIGALALAAGALCMRESRTPRAGGIDWPGALSFTAALSLFTYAILQAPRSGWGSAGVLALLAGAALLLGAFVLIERRAAQPMLDLSLLRYPAFVGVQFLAAAPAYSYVVLLVLLPIRLIGIEGYAAIEAGQIMVALSAPMLVVPLLAAQASRHIGAGVLAATGLLLAAAGLLWLSSCAPGQPVARMLAPMLLIGFGISLPWGLMDGLAISVVPKEQAGMAAGIFSTTRVAGEGVALAVVAAALAALIDTGLRAAGASAAPAALAPAALAEAAQRIAMGDLERALALLPHASHALLAQVYGDAFRILLYLLAALTTLTALLILHFLGSAAQGHAPARR